MIEQLSVTSLVITNKAQRPIDLDAFYNIASKKCQPVKSIFESIRNRLFFVRLTITPTGPQKVQIDKVVECANDDMYKIIRTSSQTSAHKSSRSSDINTVVTDKQVLKSKPEDKNTKDWLDSVSVPNK